MTLPAHITRRNILIGGACSLALPHSAFAADEPQRPSALQTEIAPGIAVRRGLEEEATRSNANAIANLTCIIGRDAVAVMDPGGSLEDGAHLRDSIRAITKLPIRYVILSHVHPDHVFGAGAFVQDSPIFVGHLNLPGALAQRGEYYRKRLNQDLGGNRAGPVIEPTMLVSDRAELDLGRRKLEVTAHPTGHSDCDLSVFDSTTSTLLTGDILFFGRVPSLDGSLRGWLKQLSNLKALPAKRAVPGHGPMSVDWPSGATDLERYLNVLMRETRSAIAKGMEITEAVETVGQSERDKWALFEAYHGHNVTKAFKELEWE
jgi:quinoprotein relay system zinc metallohydrolase 2